MAFGYALVGKTICFCGPRCNQPQHEAWNQTSFSGFVWVSDKLSRMRRVTLSRTRKPNMSSGYRLTGPFPLYPATLLHLILQSLETIHSLHFGLMCHCQYFPLVNHLAECVVITPGFQNASCVLTTPGL